MQKNDSTNLTNNGHKYDYMNFFAPSTSTISTNTKCIYIISKKYDYVYINKDY